MPQLKSIRTLEELCWKTFLRHFEKLREEAQHLPPFLINQLFNRCRRIINEQLPAKLFIHPDTKELNALTCFDLSVTKVTKKIQETCKRLQKIKLRNNFIDVTRNNPHLIDLDLSRSLAVHNTDLRIIARHCPRLKHLNLKDCHHISDYGMKFLPPTITHLDLSDTKVTAKGCVVALNLLQSLKNLTHQNWIEILDLLKTEKCPKTYSIEKLMFISMGVTDFDFSNIAIDFFPKLRDIEIIFTFMYVPNPTYALQNGCCHKITSVSVIDFPIDIIRIVGHFFPTLEDFTFVNDFGDFPVVHFDTPKHVPFKHLRKADLNFEGFDVSKESYLILFKNCDKLEELRIKSFNNELVNEFINDIIPFNPMHHLKRLTFSYCDVLEIESVTSMVQSLRCLKNLEFQLCDQFSKDEYINLKEFFKSRNWDLDVKICCLMCNESK